jgi:hypothetical protein
MRLAIVGSTKLVDDPRVERIIRQSIKKHRPTTVVSGGAKGVDSTAAWVAKEEGIEVQEHRPTVFQWEGPGGFKERNELIASNCDVLIRIASKDATTYGSGWTRDKAVQLGRPTEEFII